VQKSTTETSVGSQQLGKHCFRSKEKHVIRPIINWKNPPAYELAKQFSKTLHNHLQLPYIYNIQNSIQLITDLKTIELSKDTRLCSFDITNMYTNIPKIWFIIKNILENNNEIGKNIQKETIHILETIIEQNYFQFDQEHYKQTDGLAMGAPTSSILAETYIQHIEHTQIYPILIQQQIIAYFRYIDDILIIYDQNRTNIDHTLNKFNKLQQTIKFTIEEQQGSIFFFRYQNTSERQKYTIFNISKTHSDRHHNTKNSCHPYEHKISGINYLLYTPIQ
jgi:hypothetical protein